MGDKSVWSVSGWKVLSFLANIFRCRNDVAVQEKLVQFCQDIVCTHTRFLSPVADQKQQGLWGWLWVWAWELGNFITFIMLYPCRPPVVAAVAPPLLAINNFASNLLAAGQVEWTTARVTSPFQVSGSWSRLWGQLFAQVHTSANCSGISGALSAA